MAAPIIAAITEFKLFCSHKKGKKEAAIILTATPKLAPELNLKYTDQLMVSKRVCINKPETDKADPAKNAAIALGSLKFNKIST